jgi:hypothetical protein
MKCETYLFRVNDQELIFNSEEELARFFINNTGRIRGSKYDPFIQFSVEFKKQDEEYGKLLALGNSNPSISHVSTDFTGDQDIYANGKMSVTKAISSVIYNPDKHSNKPLVADYNEDAFLVHQRAAIEEEQGKRIDDDLWNEYKQQFRKNCENLGKWGTAIHKIAELSFKNDGKTMEEVKSEFLTSREARDLNPEILDNCFNYIANVKSKLKARHGDDCKFITELRIVGKPAAPSAAALIGRVDLIVVDKNGQAHVYDFKTSPTEYNKQNKIKGLKNAYQLAFYKEILAQMGIKTKNMQLGIIPIRMLDVDYENNTFSGINSDVILDIINKGNDMSEFYRGRRDEWANGGRFDRIKQVLQSTDLNEAIETDTLGYDKIRSIRRVAFGYDLSSKASELNFGLEETKKYKIKKNVEGEWLAKHPYSPGVFEKFKTKEEAEAKITEWFNENEGKTWTRANEMANTFNEAKNKEQTEFDYAEFRKADRNYVDWMNKLFRKYLKPEWKLNESLLPVGVMVFYNDAEKTMDILSFTDLDMNGDVKFNRASKYITGNLQSDGKMDPSTFRANQGNMELMAAMFAVNEFLGKEKLPYRINSIKCANTRKRGSKSANAAVQPNALMLSNFNQLVRLINEADPELGVVNNFIGEDPNLEFTPQIEQYTNLIQDVINDANALISSGRKAALEKQHKSLLEIMEAPKQEALATLIEMEQEIRKLFFGDTEDLSSMRELFRTEEGEILKMFYAALNDCKGLFYENRYADVSGWNLRETELLTTVQRSMMSQTRVLQQQLMQESKNTIYKRCNKELAEVMRAGSDYMQDTFSLDGAFNAYDNLIEMIDGLEPEFKIKNPYDDKSNLTETEKKYAKEFLRILNKYRYPSTNGDHESPEAAELMNSGEWFDIPLKEGGLVNKTTGNNGFFKGIKGYFEDIKNKYINPLFLQDSLDDDGLKRRNAKDPYRGQFEGYINPLAFNGDQRKNMLMNKGTSYFSRDLSDILANYVYQEVVRQEMDKNLRYVRGAIIMALGAEFDNDMRTPDMIDHLIKRYRAEIYHDNFFSDAVKPYMGAYAVFDKAMSVAMLGGNVVSTIRETATGLNLIYSRLAAGFGRESDRPTLLELSKAYAMVTAGGAAGLLVQNKIEALDRRFGVVGMAMSDLVDAYRARYSQFTDAAFNTQFGMSMLKIPDFIHRSAFLVAYMMHDGSWDAYEYNDQTGSLDYNFNKDKRFEYVKKFAKGEAIPKGQEHNISIYHMMLDAENKVREANDLEPKKFGDALDDGITTKKISTIKNLAAQILGNIDHETRPLIYRMEWGVILGKFKSYAATKLHNWSAIPTKGQAYDIMYKTDPETGKTLYLTRKIVDGQVVIGETTDPSDPDCTGQKVLAEQPYLESGMYYAFKDAWNYITKPEMRSIIADDLKNSPQKVAALKEGLWDILLILLAGIFGGSVFKLDEAKKDNKFKYDMVMAAVMNPIQDNNPVSIVNQIVDVFNVPTFSGASRVYNNFLGYITSDTPNFARTISSVGIGKVARWADN